MKRFEAVVLAGLILGWAGSSTPAAAASKAKRSTGGRTLTPPSRLTKPSTLSRATDTGASSTTNVMTGTFEWTGKTGERTALKAVFTPAGAKEWDVTFTFTWDGPKEYKGKASGNLEEGKLTGTATDGGRTWRFDAKATRGNIKGKHFETSGGKDEPTGDFELKST